MTDLDRRTVAIGAVWAVPVLALAITTPLAAASVPPTETKNRIRFTNITATVGKKANTIYANTRVQVIDGPDSVEQVMLTVALSRDGVTQTRTYPLIGGWASAEQEYFEFPNVPKGGPVTVTFTAWALNVATIVGSASVETPKWWA